MAKEEEFKKKGTQEKITNQKTAKRLPVNDNQVYRFIDYPNQPKIDKNLQITKKEQISAKLGLPQHIQTLSNPKSANPCTQ